MRILRAITLSLILGSLLVTGKSAASFEIPDRFLLGRIITFLAGAIAEEECLGASQGGDGDDQRQVGFMLADIGWPKSTGDDDTDFDRYVERLKDRTRGLVRRHRDTIAHVASELLEHDTLEGEEIDSILRHCT